MPSRHEVSAKPHRSLRPRCPLRPLFPTSTAILYHLPVLRHQIGANNDPTQTNNPPQARCLRPRCPPRLLLFLTAGPTICEVSRSLRPRCPLSSSAPLPLQTASPTIAKPRPAQQRSNTVIQPHCPLRLLFPSSTAAPASPSPHQHNDPMHLTGTPPQHGQAPTATTIHRPTIHRPRGMSRQSRFSLAPLPHHVPPSSQSSSAPLPHRHGSPTVAKPPTAQRSNANQNNRPTTVRSPRPSILAVLLGSSSPPARAVRPPSYHLRVFRRQVGAKSASSPHRPGPSVLAVLPAPLPHRHGNPPPGQPPNTCSRMACPSSCLVPPSSRFKCQVGTKSAPNPHRDSDPTQATACPTIFHYLPVLSAKSAPRSQRQTPTGDNDPNTCSPTTVQQPCRPGPSVLAVLLGSSSPPARHVPPSSCHGSSAIFPS